MNDFSRPVRLSLLGSIDLRVNDDAEARALVTQPKRLAVFVYIALAAHNTFIRRDHLLAVFWPDLDQERARAALRDTLYHIRKSVGAELIETRGAEEVRINAGLLECDVLDFRAAIARADFAAAANLYKGELLAGFHISGSPDFETWLDTQRTSLRNDACKSFTDLASSALARDAFPDAVRHYRSALKTSPFHESLLFGLMEALEMSGDALAALAESEGFVQRRQQLGLLASPTLIRRVDLLKHRMYATSVVCPPNTTAESPTPQSPPISSPDPITSDVTSAATAPAGSTPSTPATGLAASRPSRHWRRTLALTSVVLVAAAIAAARFGLKPAAKAGPRTAQVVIAPFEVRGDKRIEYLREGMVDLLVAKFDGAAGMHVVDPKAMLENLPGTSDVTSLDIGRGLARRFGAQHFVTGTVVAVGSALQLSATLYDANGNVITRVDRVAATDADLLTATDGLARELLAGFLKKSDTQLASLAALSTSSYPAVQKYLEGEQAFRAGAYDDAVRAFQEATNADSTFALAHYRLSSAADWAGQADVAERAAQTAMRLKNRLPREAAALVTARWEYWFGDARRADEIYKELTASRPTDVEAWFEQGEVLFHAGPWMGRSMEDAEPAFRRVLSLDSTHIGAMMHLARVAALAHRVSLLDSLLATAVRIDPAHERTLEIRALRAASINDARAIDSVIDLLAVHDNGDAVNADAERVAVYTGNLSMAERIARLGSSPTRAHRPRMIGLQSLAHILTGEGRWKDAREQIDLLASLDPTIAAELRANLTAMPAAHATTQDVAYAKQQLLARAPALINTAAADPAHFEDARRTYHIGLLAALSQSGDVQTYIDKLAGDTTGGDAGVFRKALAGSLQAHMLAIHGDSARALEVLEKTWLPPRKPLMIGWAWTHANATDRLFRAALLAHAGRYDEAVKWCAAVREDIAGSPVLLADAERVRQRALHH